MAILKKYDIANIDSYRIPRFYAPSHVFTKSIFSPLRFDLIIISPWDEILKSLND